MDSQEKCTTWVGNMCKKVETLCSGIDNIIPQEKTPYLEDTEICDIPSCEILKEADDDERHTDEISNSNSCDGISSTGLSSDGKEMSFEQNPINVTLISSDLPKLEAPEKDDIGMTPSVCGANQSHDGEIVNLPSPKSAKCQSSCSSAKAGGIAEPEYAQVYSSTIHQLAIVSAGFDDCKILENEVSSSGIALSKALNNTTESCCEFVETEEMVTFSVSDGPGDSKAEQTEDNHIGATGMNISEPLGELMIDHDCLILGSNNISTSSDFQVEDSTPQVKLEKGWEFIKMAGSEDHHVESDQRRGKSLEQSLEPREPESNNQDFCESDWEIV